MYNPWPDELRRLLFLLFIALLAGWLIGHVWLVLFLALLGYIGWHLKQLYRLEGWLRKGRKIHPPEALGVWGSVSEHIYRLQQRNRKRKRALGSMLNRFQTASAAMPYAIVSLNSQYEIEWFNQAAQRLLGLKHPQDSNQRIHNLLRQPAFLQYLDAESEDPIQITSPVDSNIALNLRVVSYGGGQQLILARDISEQQKLDQMRRDFVANVSHELRTPLTVMNGFLETLGDQPEDYDAQTRKAIELMSQQGQRMQNIVSDLLLLSRLENERDESPQDKVHLAALIAMIYEEAQHLSGEQGHDIRLDCASGLAVYGYEKELYSAFNNLVSNAVRYTPAGGRIDLRCYEDEAGVHFEVADSGDGIAPEHIPRLTERFYRVDVGRSRDMGGTGLGLAIVKHVLLRHRASLRILSTPGQGSRFICDFPATRQSD